MELQINKSFLFTIANAPEIFIIKKIYALYRKIFIRINYLNKIQNMIDDKRLDPKMPSN